MATSQAYCLRRNNHPSDMIEDFEKMWKEETMIDVTLTCEEGTIRAHKMVLSACSSYFKSIFSKLTNPYQYPVVIIKDMPFVDLKAIVDFIYRGEVTVPQDQLTSVLKSAESLKVKGLSEVNSPKGNKSGDEGRSSSSQSRKRRKKRRKASTSSQGNERDANDGEVVSEDDAATDKQLRDSTDDNSEYTDEDDDQHQSCTRITAVHQTNDDRNFNETASTVEGDIEPSRLLEQSMITGETHENGNTDPRFQSVNMSNVQSMGSMGNDDAKPIAFDETSGLMPQLAAALPTQMSGNESSLPPNASQNHGPVSAPCNLTPFDGGLPSMPGPSNVSQVVPRSSQPQEPHFGHSSSGHPPQTAHPHSSSLLSPSSGILSHHPLGCHSLSALSVDSLGSRRHYQCPICLKGFSEKGNMKRHTQIHLQQRNRYCCDLCSKCFAWKDNFNRHRRIAHTETDEK